MQINNLPELASRPHLYQNSTGDWNGKDIKILPTSERAWLIPQIQIKTIEPLPNLEKKASYDRSTAVTSRITPQA